MNNAEAAIVIFFVSVMAPSSSTTPTPAPVSVVSAGHAVEHLMEEVTVTSIMGEPEFHVEIGESFLITNN